MVWVMVRIRVRVMPKTLWLVRSGVTVSIMIS